MATRVQPKYANIACDKASACVLYQSGIQIPRHPISAFRPNMRDEWQLRSWNRDSFPFMIVNH